MQDWETLDKFSKEKKSPIGYKPFVDVCIKYNAFKEAIKYIPKLEPPQQVDYFMRINLYKEAAAVAISLKDNDMLTAIRNKCANKDTQFEIDKMAAEFRKTK